jgi:hypothetical protein
MITRADAGNVPVQRAALRVMEVAREAANLFGVLIEEKSLRLVLEGDERVEVEAYRVILKEAFVYNPQRRELLTCRGRNCRTRTESGRYSSNGGGRRSRTGNSS